MLDGEDDGEHNGDSFVEISKMFVTQKVFFIGTAPFDGEYTLLN